MAMTTIETLRLYLRDQSDDPRFSDEDLQFLLDGAGTTEGACALGWLLVAAEAGENPVSQSVGNTSESWGQPTEVFKVAMRMHEYWDTRDQVLNGGSDWAAGGWMELVPDPESGTIVSRLVEHQEFLLEYYASITTS
jgi:hypothetical protein